MLLDRRGWGFMTRSRRFVGAVLVVAGLVCGSCSSSPEPAGDEAVSAEETAPPVAKEKKEKKEKKGKKEKAAEPSPETEEEISSDEGGEEPVEAEDEAAAPAEISQGSVELPDPNSFEPFYKAPDAAEKEPVVSRLVGLDTSVFFTFAVDAKGSKERRLKTRNLEKEAKRLLKAKRTLNYLAVREQILDRYREQAAYMDFLLATGLKDPGIPDPAIASSKLYALIIKTTKLLRSQLSSSPKYRQWLAEEIVARMRVGDSGVREEAREYITNNRESALSIRIRLVAVAEDAVQGIFGGEFGRPSQVLKLRQAEVPQAALHFLAAREVEAQGNAAVAYRAYFDALQKLVRIGAAEKEKAPLLVAGVQRLVKLALTAHPGMLDQSLQEFLGKFGFTDLLRFYSEQVALQAREKSPTQAIPIYGALESSPGIPPPERIRLRARMLDLAIAARDPVGIAEGWKRLLELQKGTAISGLDARAVATQEVLKKIATEKPTQENVLALLKMHDLLWSSVPRYREGEAWVIEILSFLASINQQRMVVERAEKALKEVKTAESKAQVFEYLVRGCESVLKLTSEPNWEKPAALLDPNLLPYVKKYLTVLDGLEKTAPDTQKELAAYNGAYVSYISGQFDEAGKRFEKAISKYSTSTYAPQAATFFIKQSAQKKDYQAVIKLQKGALQAFGGSPKDAPPDLQGMVQTAFLEEGKKDVAAKRYDAGVEKFSLCMSAAPEGGMKTACLTERAQALLQSGKKSEAVRDLEALASTQAESESGAETLVEAAQLAESVNDWPRAAVLYVKCAKTFPTKATKLRAWYRAGHAYRKANDHKKSVGAFQLHLKEATDPKDKVNTLKEISSAAVALKDLARARTFAQKALEEITKNPSLASPDDALLLRERMLDAQVAESTDSTSIRALCQEMMKLKPTTPEGSLALAKSKRVFGNELANSVEASINNGMAFETIMEGYEEAKKHLNVECTIPKSKWCASNKFRIAELAARIADAYKNLSADERSRVSPFFRTRLGGLRTQVGMYLDEASEKLKSNGSEDPELKARIRELRAASKS